MPKTAVIKEKNRFFFLNCVIVLLVVKLSEMINGLIVNCGIWHTTRTFCTDSVDKKPNNLSIYG